MRERERESLRVECWVLCRRSDGVFVARAEMRALESLNAKLTKELLSLEERCERLTLEARTEVFPRRRRVARGEVCDRAGTHATVVFWTTESV